MTWGDAGFFLSSSSRVNRISRDFASRPAIKQDIMSSYELPGTALKTSWFRIGNTR